MTERKLQTALKNAKKLADDRQKSIDDLRGKNHQLEVMAARLSTIATALARRVCPDDGAHCHTDIVIPAEELDTLLRYYGEVRELQDGGCTFSVRLREDGNFPYNKKD